MKWVSAIQRESPKIHFVFQSATIPSAISASKNGLKIRIVARTAVIPFHQRCRAEELLLRNKCGWFRCSSREHVFKQYHRGIDIDALFHLKCRHLKILAGKLNKIQDLKLVCG